MKKFLLVAMIAFGAPALADVPILPYCKSALTQQILLGIGGAPYETHKHSYYTGIGRAIKPAYKEEFFQNMLMFVYEEIGEQKSGREISSSFARRTSEFLCEFFLTKQKEIWLE